MTGNLHCVYGSKAADNYWYDSATPLTLTLNGIGNRGSDTSLRLTSYTVNGATTSLATKNEVAVLRGSPLNSPETVSGTYMTQYLLNTPSGSLVSETAPAINGDTG